MRGIISKICHPALPSTEELYHSFLQKSWRMRWKRRFAKPKNGSWVSAHYTRTCIKLAKRWLRYGILYSHCEGFVASMQGTKLPLRLYTGQRRNWCRGNPLRCTLQKSVWACVQKISCSNHSCLLCKEEAAVDMPTVMLPPKCTECRVHLKLKRPRIFSLTVLLAPRHRER